MRLSVISNTMTQRIAPLAALLALLPGQVLSAGAAATEISPETKATYQAQCASCHGADRLGGIGPALLPGNLKRLRAEAAGKVIAAGRPATQMPAFSDTLGEARIQGLVKLIYTEPEVAPQWGLAQIRASHQVDRSALDLPDRPVFDADPMNLFVVVELGDHHATLLDGDRFEPIHRFPTRYALHGGPKYSPDGRFVYFASRDGWITKYDIYNLRVVAEIRAGINTRNLAVSADGSYALVGNYLPHSLVVLDTRDMRPLKVIDVADRDGHGSRVSAVYTAAPRGSFIAALKDVAEVWEISYENPPPKGFSGWMHDYRDDSGEADNATSFPVRRLAVEEILDDFFFDPDYLFLIGAARDGNGQVLDLDSGRVTTRIELPGMPHLGSGITWQYQGRTVMATPNLKEGTVSIVDMRTWETIKRIPTLGPGFFMRSHENTPYAWVDVFFGKEREAMHVIDKRSLEIVRTLRPAPGKTAAHVEFDRSGRHALVSVWDDDGALVVYDADSLQEVKRLPMRKPSGKYNVYNKVNLSAGTSH